MKQSNYIINLSKMYLNTRIEDHSFQLSIGSGHNDWAWLSHYVARKFAKIAYPQGKYLPTFLQIISKDGQAYCPPPKSKINTFIQQNKLDPSKLTVYVRIRKPNSHLADEQKDWQKDSFGIQRFMMNVVYLLENNYEPNKPGSKDYFFKVVYDYVMHPDVRHIFSDRKFHQQISIELQQKGIGPKSCTFNSKLKIPFGTLKPELYCYRKDPQDPKSYRAQKIKDPKDKPDFKISFSTSPQFFSAQQINTKVAQQMKISENITKSLQQKQQQANKRNTNSSFCCFSFEDLWKILETNHGDQLMLESYDSSTKQRLKIILEKSLNSIYGVFFYYFIVEDQPKQKKQQLGVTYQQIMHFLRFYQIFSDIQSLQGFLEYYNSDFKFKSIHDTLDIQEKSVKFPQFVAILLRSIQFLQTSTFMVKGETFDVSVANIIDKIMEIEGQQDQFSDFKKNLRINPKIISFFAQNSEKIKAIYINQAVQSTQNSADNFVIMRQQFKSMLQLSGLATKSTDTTVDNLYIDLDLPEDGVFYYEFLEAIQWLAVVTVNSQRDEEQLQNDEQKQMILIEKIKFFMEKLQI